MFIAVLLSFLVYFNISLKYANKVFFQPLKLKWLPYVPPT